MITEMHHQLILAHWHDHQRHVEQHYDDMMGELTGRTGLSEDEIESVFD